jgi:hypothetical protein
VCTRSSGRRQLGQGIVEATHKLGWPQWQLESMAAGGFGAASGPAARG